jgi:hypothetical protein
LRKLGNAHSQAVWQGTKRTPETRRAPLGLARSQPTAEDADSVLQDSNFLAHSLALDNIMVDGRPAVIVYDPREYSERTVTAAHSQEHSRDMRTAYRRVSDLVEVLSHN